MTAAETRTLELRDYLRVLWRRKWTIVVTIAVCVTVASFMALRQKPVYSTKTSVLLDQRLVDTLFVESQLRTDTVSADRQRGNEIQIMDGPTVLAQVKELLGEEPVPVSFTPLEGTDVVEIAARGEDPERLAATVNAFAKTYIAVRTDLTVSQLDEAAAEVQTQMNRIDEQIRQIDASLAASPPAPDTVVQGRTISTSDARVAQRNQLAANRSRFETQQGQLQLASTVAKQSSAEIIAPAGVPKKPLNRSPLSNVMGGLAIGVVLGIALAFLREYLDDTVKTKDDLEAASGLTAIGLVPALTDWKKREATPLISVMQPRSPAAEAYRSVRTSVEFLGLDQPLGSIQVTSALASEGKTSTLANLAVTFARAGQRVIVLCCDLRRPRVHEFFGLSNRVGFTSVLLGDAPMANAIQKADRELPIGLVASGPLPPNPAELLASKRAVEVIEELDRRCDLLLIDSPPVLPVTDALVISGLVDGVLLVAGAGSSTKRGVKRSAELLRQVDAPLIGSILNGVQSKHEYGYAYGDNRYYLDGASTAPQPADETRNGRSRTGVAARPSR
ncbi:MAG: polysaccharide biosynthesis tyrosine autokinase [Actinomycetota bacterium]